MSIALLALLLAGVAAAREKEELHACFVSLNEPAEVEMFRTHLDRDRFALVDIEPPQISPETTIGNANAQWILAACIPDLRCDLVVISGEFAGAFFGTRGALTLQAMEEASCEARCAGLFHAPREVFLLGCNTLATKSEDQRTPDAYLQVLLEHGFDRALAERVVELRYGPLGPSFRQSLRRIFAGVPHLYGFGSVAPRSERSAAMLERYLHATPDYVAVLSRDGERNAALRAAFAGTALTETTGLMPHEAGARERDDVCALYDESRSLDVRLRIAYGLLLRPDALRFVPTLQTFFTRHAPENYGTIERSVFLEMQAVDGAHDAVLVLIGALDVSALQLELAHFAALLGWIQPRELHRLAARGAAYLLHGERTSEAVDVVCAIVQHQSLRGEFTADDLPAEIYSTADGLRLVACLAPADPRVSLRVLPALRASDRLQREWAAYALAQMRPSDPAVLMELVPYLRDPSPDIAARIRWLLQDQSPLPPAVQRAIEEIDRSAPDADGRTRRSGGDPAGSE